MKTKIILASLILTLSFIANAANLSDAKLAKKAEVILRVKLTQGIAVCDKYCQEKVEILEVLKNNSAYSFSETVDIFYRSGEKGVPFGISTIYLEKYAPSRNDLWKLVGGKRETGGSHYTIVKIGMPLSEVEEFMGSLGATDAAMDMMVEEGYDLKNYQLPDGRVLSVVSEKIKGIWVVNSINVCTNPNTPKLERTWENISEFNS